MSPLSANPTTSASSAGIKVICVGLGRTGTLSLTEALKKLGYQPYHYIDFGHHEQWSNVADGQKDSVESILDLIEKEGYDAILENPASDVYQDILRKYPTAKVILTVRDDPQAFVRSWKLLFDTMVITEQKFSLSFPSFLGYIPLFSNLRKIRYFMGTTHLGLSPGALTHTWRDNPDCDKWLAEQYVRHNEHVIQTVPKDQLLVFNVKEGWAPLCEFLGKPLMPKTLQFPHSNVNNAASLKRLKSYFFVIVYGWIPIVVVGTASCLYFRNEVQIIPPRLLRFLFPSKSTT